MHSTSLENHWLYDWHSGGNNRSCNGKTLRDACTGRCGRHEVWQTSCPCGSSSLSPPPAVQHAELKAAVRATRRTGETVQRSGAYSSPSSHYTKFSEYETGERRMWSLEDFEIARKLDEGRFGKVYLAREKNTKCAVVLKCLSKNMIRYHNLFHQLRREVELQEYAGRHHPHILRLFAYFWDDMNIFLVLEYAEGGNLQTLLDSREHHRLLEGEVRAILRSLLSALTFLHERDIIHRDIKPENILFKVKEVKLADFSWAVRLSERDVRHNRRYTLCGTLDYLSPELVSRRGYTTKADVWSVGVLTYRLLCGRLPFEHHSAGETCGRITKGNVCYPEYLSIEAREFIAALLCVNESRRISCMEALQHPFIRNESSGLRLYGADTALPGSLSVDCSATPVRWATPFMEFPEHSPRVLERRQEQELLDSRVEKGYYEDEYKHDLAHHVETQNGFFSLTTGRSAPLVTTTTAPAASKVSSAAQSASISCTSFVTVSSLHSTDCIPSIQNISLPSALSSSQTDCMPSVVSTTVHVSATSTTITNAAALATGVVSKSYSEDVGTSSQGASYTRPRLHSSEGDRGGTTMTSHGTFLASSSALSPFLMPYYTGTGDICSGIQEEENNCVVQLCFDDSVTSLSQLTGASEATAYVYPNK